MEKILAVYLNSIIYELNNILYRDKYSYSGQEWGASELDDLFRSNNSEHKSTLFSREQLKYFAHVFFKKDEKGKLVRKGDEENGFILRMLASARHSLAHHQSNNKQNAFLYRLEEIDDSSASENDRNVVNTLDSFYDARVIELNDSFDRYTKTDLTILFRALGAETRDAKAELAQEYYDYTVRKAQKNLGFSVKQLREIFLRLPTAVDEDGRALSAQNYDTVRHKLNNLIDFLAYRYYRSHPERSEDMVSRLRSEPFEQKASIYEREARFLWKNIQRDVLCGIVPKVRDINYVSANPDPDTAELVADKVVPSSTSRFSKFMYLMTLFLDGKEINDLLSTLENKFLNIDSFLHVLEELQAQGVMEAADFKPLYKLFNESGRIAGELHVIRSFARMQKPDECAKRIMFVEAAQMLGSDMSEEELTEYFNAMLAKPQPGEKKQNGFRNFIINNVIESSRFKYLIRYAGPLQARRMANNGKVMAFVLSTLPDDQIHRYYESCREDWEELILPENLSGRRDALVKKITGLRFSDFENVRQENGGTMKEQADKQRKRSVIGLYLTVLYLLTKNLVYVNSRYFMAFHARERDKAMMGLNQVRNTEYLDFSSAALSRVRMNSRARRYLEQNLENAKKIGNNIILVYRNKTEHLNAIRIADRYLDDIREIDSYFALYHYIMQRQLMDLYEAGDIERNPDSDLLDQYFRCVKKYGTYCKDLVKALNIPFGYNLPRYKNLSIDGLFDRNRPGSGKKTIAPEGGNE